MPGGFFSSLTVSAEEMKDFGKDRLNSSPRHGEWVEIQSNGRSLKAFVVYPERKEKAPVVLVIHEIFGLTDWVRSLCDELAENGVIAIAPDLLSGQKFEDMDGARKAISALKEEAVKADLDATADYALTKIPAANGHLGVCGFCWGGGWAFKYANLNSNLKAAYSFYGATPDDPSKVKNIAGPVYGFYAELDSSDYSHCSESGRVDENCREKIRAGNLQRRRARFHALWGSRKSNPARGRSDGAR